MQSSDKLLTIKLFHQPFIEHKDEYEEKIERARNSLQRYGGRGNASEKETHDALHSAACRDKSLHDEICIGLLGTILLEKESATRSYRDLSLLNRDNFVIVVENLSHIILEKYHKLTDETRIQLVWVLREMVKGGILGADMLCWNLMRQIAGGDVSARNLWLADYMLDIYIEYRVVWLNKYPVLIAAVIYTYLRILEDHFPQTLANLRQKEVSFVVSLIREHFSEVCLNQQIGLGRDLVRQLQALYKIPEIQDLWTDLLHHPRNLSPHFTGVIQLLNMRTSRKYIQARLTPDMEKKVNFLTSSVKFGLQKRYQDWFQKQYLCSSESQTLRADIIRYIVCVIHPPNEILSSDILPRWALIGWLLTTCTNGVAASTAKLALFFDWLVYDPIRDNIMNIEPGILVMYHSLKTYLSITATLLDFLLRLTYEYYPAFVDRFKSGVGSALKSIIEKRVLQNLDALFESPKLESELRRSIKEKLFILIDGTTIPTSETPHPSPTPDSSSLDSPPIIHSNNNISKMDKNSSSDLFFSLSNHRNSPPLLPNNNTSSNISNINNNSSNANVSLVVSSDSSVHITSNVSNVTSNSAISNSLCKDKSGDEESEDAEFSDDESSGISRGGINSSKIKEGDNGVMRCELVNNKCASLLGDEEEEREKIYERVEGLPTNLRLPLNSLLSESENKLSNRLDSLDEVISALSEEQLDKYRREDVAKCLSFIFRNELNRPSVNDDSNYVNEYLKISPVNELISQVIRLKPNDKSLKMKNFMRVLADMVSATPSLAYKLLIILNQALERDPDFEDIRYNSNCYSMLYKNLAQLRGMKLEAQLNQDLKHCWEQEPLALAYVFQVAYFWFNDDVGLTSSAELLHLLVSSIDALQLQDLIWKVMNDEVIVFEDHNLVPVLQKTLEWETWEQHCVWTLVDAHKFKMDDLLPIIPQLEFRRNPEALSFLLSLLRRESVNHSIINCLLSRKVTPKDKFVVTLLSHWSDSSSDKLAESLSNVLVQASGGSPIKRKRGVSSSRGNVSPAPLPSPTADQVLAHLDQLRLISSDGEVFKKDVMVAALLQVQSWVTESQKTKYRELLSLSASAEDYSSSSKSSSKKSTNLLSRPLPSSPPSSKGGGGNSKGSLSRTRSGRVSSKTSVSENESESEEEDDDVIIIPPPSKKKKKNPNVYYSDSD